MTKEDAKTLKIGDRVIWNTWCDKDFGVIVEGGYVFVRVQWESGLLDTFALNDGDEHLLVYMHRR